MIHTKLFGIRILLSVVSVTIILLMISCNRFSCYRGLTLITDNMYTNVINDSVKINLQYFGDYKLKQSNMQIGLPFRWKMYNLFNKNKFKFMHTFYTNDSPFFTSKIYVNKFKKNVERHFTKINDSLYVAKSDMTSTKVSYLIHINDNVILMISEPTKGKNFEYSKNELTAIINDEFSQIIKNSSFGKNLSRDTLSNPFETGEESFLKNYDYFKPIKILSERSDEYFNSSLYKDSYLQVLATYTSFVHDKSTVNKILGQREYDVSSSVELGKYKPIACKTIADKLKSGQQVIMFNESHFEPDNRFVVSAMLPFLYDNGFKYLAIEDINQEFSKSTDFPSMTSGFYVRDYQMSNLIRHAIKLGLKVIPYDDDSNREFNQAKNLFERTLKKDNNAKILVLAGHSHINKGSDNKRWMASYFKQITGIEPLTINQERFNSYSDSLNNVGDSTINFYKPLKFDPQGDYFLINNMKVSDIIYIGDSVKYTEFNQLNSSDSLVSDIKGIQLFIYDELQRSKSATPCYTRIINGHGKFRLTLPASKYIIKYFYSDAIKEEVLDLSTGGSPLTLRNNELIRTNFNLEK